MREKHISLLRLIIIVLFFMAAYDVIAKTYTINEINEKCGSALDDLITAGLSRCLLLC